MHSTTNTGAMSPEGPTATKKAPFHGPCYLKMLVSNLVAGSIIGKNGSVIAQMEQKSGASMKLSPTNQFFPQTSDRIVVMSGEQEQVNKAMAFILEKISEVAAVGQYVPDVTQPQLARCELNCKMVVPKSAVSGIIGKAGQQIKQLQEDTGAKIQISNREQGRHERVISITGTLDSIHNAGCQIATVIQEDSNLKDHMYLIYSPVAAGGAGMYGPAKPFGGYGQFFGAGAGGGGYMYGAPFGAGQAGSPVPQSANNELEQLMMEQCEITVEIPDVSIGAVIGKSGMHLAEIMRTTGANIKMSQKGDLIPGTQNRRVTVIGPVSAVHKAHARLLLRLKESATRQAASMGAPYGGQGQMAGMPQGGPGNHAGYGQYGMANAAQYSQLPGGQFGYY